MEKDILGKVMQKVVNIGNERLIFESTCGLNYEFYHAQNCCESVYIDDISGDLNDLVGVPILMFEESSNEDEKVPDDYGSGTWTFYKFATVKGYVTVKWYGSSNGYYSERVDFTIYER